MARLQILELPEGSNDDRPPFVLVIDQVDDDSPLITDGPDIWPGFKNDTGCQHVIVTTETIDIPANDTSATSRQPAPNRNSSSSSATRTYVLSSTRPSVGTPTAPTEE